MKTILIIDDETDLCALLKTALTRQNYVIDCAYSLSEAEIKLRQHPNIVLLDNNLPDGTGLEYIQMHPVAFMETYVVMISADANSVLQQKAKQEGVDIFLQKPFTISSISALLRQIA